MQLSPSTSAPDSHLHRRRPVGHYTPLSRPVRRSAWAGRGAGSVVAEVPPRAFQSAKRGECSGSRRRKAATIHHEPARVVGSGGLWCRRGRPTRWSRRTRSAVACQQGLQITSRKPQPKLAADGNCGAVAPRRAVAAASVPGAPGGRENRPTSARHPSRETSPGSWRTPTPNLSSAWGPLQ
jgi:hypothetical protein